MQIFEFIVIGQDEKVIDSLLPDVPLTSIQVSGQTVLRGELSPTAVMMIYPILFNNTPSDAFIRKIVSHASGILISSAITEGEQWLQNHDFWQQYLTSEPVQPVLWIVPLSGELPSGARKIGELPGGLFLGQKSRMFFVQFNDEHVRKKIWRTLFMELMPVTLSEE